MQAQEARWQGRLKQDQLNARAAQTEDEAKAAWTISTENQKRMQENKTHAQASARNAQAASGFDSEGSGAVQELSVAEQMEQMIADAAMSSAIQENNARFAAAQMRGQGELEMMGAEVNARQYEQLSQNAKKAAGIQAVAGLAGAALGGVTGGWGGALSMAGNFGNIAGNFTQLMPGTMAASQSSLASFGTDVRDIWRGFGGSDLYERSEKNASFFNFV